MKFEICNLEDGGQPGSFGLATSPTVASTTSQSSAAALTRSVGVDPTSDPRLPWPVPEEHLTLLWRVNGVPSGFADVILHPVPQVTRFRDDLTAGQVSPRMAFLPCSVDTPSARSRPVDNSMESLGTRFSPTVTRSFNVNHALSTELAPWFIYPSTPFF